MAYLDLRKYVNGSWNPFVTPGVDLAKVFQYCPALQWQHLVNRGVTAHAAGPVNLFILCPPLSFLFFFTFLQPCSSTFYLDGRTSFSELFLRHQKNLLRLAALHAGTRVCFAVACTVQHSTTWSACIWACCRLIGLLLHPGKRITNSSLLEFERLHASEFNVAPWLSFFTVE